MTSFAFNSDPKWNCKDLVLVGREERKKLSNENGQASFSYHLKKGFGVESHRKLQLNFDNLTIIFPDSHGSLITLDISDIVSMSRTNTQTTLLVHIRMEILKEKLWTFSSLEELLKFQNLANAMYNHGKRLRYLFNLIDIDKKNYLDEHSLTNVILNDNNINSNDFLEYGIIKLINECDVLLTGKVTFSEFFIVFINSNAKSLTELLTVWKSISEDTHTLISFNDNNNNNETFIIDTGLLNNSGENINSLNVNNNNNNNNDKSSLINFLQTLQINKKSFKLRSECLYVGLSDNIELYSNSTFVDTTKSGILKTKPSSENLTKVSSSFFGNNSAILFPNMLPGEKVLLNTEEIVFVDGSTLNQIVGTLGIIILTNYRICFASSKVNKNVTNFNSPSTSQYVMIPISTVCGITNVVEKTKGFNSSILINCKDMRIFHIMFNDNYPKVSSFIEYFGNSLRLAVFPVNIKDLFAFTYTSFYNDIKKIPYNEKDKNSKTSLDFNTGWDIYDPTLEFHRQGVLSKLNCLEDDSCDIIRWRLWSDDYNLVSTYPSAFIVPAQMTDNEIVEAAKFRSRQRLPSLTWMDPKSNSCLVRSSQPMTGISNHRNIADKLLLNFYRCKGDTHDQARQNSKFYVIDCRSQLAANANAALGKGVEDWKYLVNTEILFCDIGNIHTMRTSLEAVYAISTHAHEDHVPQNMQGPLQQLYHFGTYLNIFSKKPPLIYPPIPTDLKESFSEETELIQEDLDINNDITRTIQSNSNNEIRHKEYSKGYWKRIEETGWIDHIRGVIAGSILVAEKLVLKESSVLVHCSDGWDRTAQVCCTAQIMLDPFYRTMKGFAVLIEKDWLAFGHKFHDRTGHAHNQIEDESKEVSPIFVQWLDVMSQFLKQFPNQFEFNEDYLVFLADSLYSCLFGTFLCNSEKERRKDHNLPNDTTSIWSYVMDDNNINNFINKSYLPSDDKNQLWPSLRRVSFWERYFNRWDKSLHPKICTGEVWKENWG